MTIEQLLTQAQISYKQAGEELKVCCPFHKEKTPSCFININSGIFHCFGCHKSGSVKKFFKELNIEADLSGISFSAPKKKSIENVVIQTLDESVLLQFRYKPQQLIDLGFDEKLLWDMEIGYHPDRKRIIYPIRDHLGNLVGVSGGSCIGMQPKYKIYGGQFYVNGLHVPSDFGEWFDELYPNYGQLEKSNYIWNFHNIYAKALKKEIPYVVITEGFKACLWLLQNNIPAVALFGSYLSDIQADLLRRVNTSYYIMLDNDEAGKKGTEEIIYKLFNVCNLHQISYNTKQPDDLLSSELEKNIANNQKISFKSFQIIAKEKNKKTCTTQQKYPRLSLLQPQSGKSLLKNRLLKSFGKSFSQKVM
jgi:DNA primase